MIIFNIAAILIYVALMTLNIHIYVRDSNNNWLNLGVAIYLLPIMIWQVMSLIRAVDKRNE